MVVVLFRVKYTRRMFDVQDELQKEGVCVSFDTHTLLGFSVFDLVHNLIHMWRLGFGGPVKGV